LQVILGTEMKNEADLLYNTTNDA